MIVSSHATCCVYLRELEPHCLGNTASVIPKRSWLTAKQLPKTIWCEPSR